MNHCLSPLRHLADALPAQIALIKPLALAGDWKTYLKAAQINSTTEFEQHGRTGRPLGKARFIEKAERLLQSNLKKKKPGPKG